MTNDIEQAVHEVQDALNLTSGEGRHLAYVVSSLIGMASETDEARVAALEEADRAREAEASARAEIEHLMKYISKHKGDPPPFEHQKPAERRTRKRSVLSPMDILHSLSDVFRLPDSDIRDVEAAPNRETDGEDATEEPSASQPDVAVDQPQDESGFDDLIAGAEGQPTAQDRVNADREQYPSVLSIEDIEPEEDLHPRLHRTGFIPVIPSEYSPHETRGCDLPPHVPEIVNPIDPQTNKITIVTGGAPSLPVKASSATEDQESPIMTETLPERRRRWWQKRKPNA